jgi:HEAT repeat protein
MYGTSRTVLAAGLLTGALLLGSPRAGAQSPKFLGKSLSKWIDQLEKSSSPRLRRSAAFALGRMGDDASLAVPDLARRVRNDKDAGVRDMAASALGEIVLDYQGEPSTLWDKVGPTLKKALEDDADARVRRSAAYGLGALARVTRAAVQREAVRGRFGEKGAADLLKRLVKEVGPNLRKALKDKVASVRQNAAWALGPLGPELDGAAIADLCELLRDGNVLVRRDAAGALGKAGRKNGRTSVRALLALVKDDKDDVVRKTALDALAKVVGPDHRTSAGDLYPLLKSKDVEVARGAAFVLGNIGGREAVPALAVLTKALADPDPAVQALAAAGLGGLGKEAASAVRSLAQTLEKSRDSVVRRNCLLALATMGSEARGAVPAIAVALKARPDPSKRGPRALAEEEVREFAAEALGRIGYPANKAAMDAVREAIDKDRNSLVRQRCIWALFGLKELEEHKLVGVLTKVLEDTDKRMLLVRYDAARVLAYGLGKNAPKKTPEVLLHMLKNRELTVYSGAAAKVEGIGGEGEKGGSKINADTGGDARFMAAIALGWMGELASKNADVVKGLRDAAKDENVKLRDTAKMALKQLDLKE